MTETITSDKTKNPGRQEWGRKLGKMSKELKLKKQLQVTSKVSGPTSEAIEPSRSIFKVEYLLGAAAVGVGLVALYYQKKSYESTKKDLTSQKPESKFTDF